MDIAFALYGGAFVDDEPFGGIPERSMAEGVALLNKFVAEKDAHISLLRDALAKLVAIQESCAMEYTEADWIAARVALATTAPSAPRPQADA